MDRIATTHQPNGTETPTDPMRSQRTLGSLFEKLQCGSSREKLRCQHLDSGAANIGFHCLDQNISTLSNQITE